MPTYYLDTRFDLDESHWKPDPEVIKEFISSQLKGVVTTATYGQETAKKTNKKHIHYRVAFEAPKLPETPMGQTFKRWFEKNYATVTLQSGSKRYITALNDVTKKFGSIKDFFQYPLKDYPRYESVPLEHQLIPPSSDLSLKDMWNRAAEMREHSLKVHEKYEQKMNNEKLVWTKIYNYIDTNLKCQPVRSYQGVAKDQDTRELFQAVGLLIVKYFQEYNEHKIPTQIDRYIIRYCSQSGRLEARDLLFYGGLSRLV